MSNKIRYGLKNVHYAPVTFGAGNAPTFGTPVPIPGAVNLSMEKSSDDIHFYADDGVYYELGDNSSFDGDLEIALIPDSFRTSMLGDTVDGNGVLFTDGAQARGHFALMFEFTGDQKGIRHVIYNCTAAPEDDTTGATRGENIEVQTEKLKLSARPLPGSNRVKARTGEEVDSDVYAGWYNAVYYNSGAVNVARLATLAITGVTLSPTFSAYETNYTAQTTDASNAVSATGADSATATILVNGSSHTSGESASWNSGNNTVVVVASKSGCTSKTYTVNLVKKSS